ncbi:MAG: methyltransferase domain-containing protein [Bacteroidota bacterium]
MKYFIFAFHKIFFFVPAHVREGIVFEGVSFIGRLFTGKLKLDKHNENLINLGSGFVRYPGIINVDFFYTKGIDYGADLRYPLKIEDNTVDGVVSEHTFEHITFASADLQFRECFRIMKPGSFIRIIVPDIELFIQRYVANDEAWFKEYERLMVTESADLSRAHKTLPTKMHALSFVLQDFGHIASWDFETMKYYLNKNGFVNIHKTEFMKGSNPKLLIDISSADRTNVSLYVEAMKPL